MRTHRHFTAGANRNESDAMTVYVESNFVLEQSLQQEECDSCAELIDLASKGEACETIDVSGIGEPDEHGATHYAIDFTPVNELVHLPVRLRPQMEIRKDH